MQIISENFFRFIQRLFYGIKSSCIISMGFGQFMDDESKLVW